MLDKKERNKRYYEKKKQKAEPQEGNFPEFELVPEAKELALKIMKAHNPDFIHSFMEYINVAYYAYLKLPDVKITTTYV